MTETHKRTLTRAILWRIIATIIIALWTGVSSAIAINIVLVLFHYFYERVWLKIEWGKMNDN